VIHGILVALAGWFLAVASYRNEPRDEIESVLRWVAIIIGVGMGVFIPITLLNYYDVIHLWRHG